ncbi:PKD domain containing protein [Halorhabdus utahensis DSM 12940]|uniref:PKD domain containing protein n=1 Tax=Halorhabdus utahensis (strain DSM 12940 / JCM 11049 / AX-2) TaxID=519442 RepID=C7NU69_HALUD|nr:PKD domain-containing protein [Halorhabdus utahensis]ACV12314.1 PKD domain containing protein [Halorhabdus utahensis DSM 12940]
MAKDDTFLSDDFEEYAIGSFPGRWQQSGNSDQKIVDEPVTSGDKALQLVGSYGSCWQALAHRELGSSLPKDESVIVRGEIDPTGEGGGGCHGTKNGSIDIRENPSAWPNVGFKRKLIQFDAEGSVRGGGIDLGSCEIGVYNSFKIEYYWDSNGEEVNLQYQINGEFRGETTVDVQTNDSGDVVESKLQYLTVVSGDYKIHVDRLSIVSGSDIITRPDLNSEISVSTATTSPGNQITFDASKSTGQIDTYKWEFSDDTSATGLTVTRSFDTTGIYSITLTTVDGDETDTTTSEVAVVRETELNFSAQPAQPVTGQSVTFEGTGGNSYTWDFGDGRGATGQQVTHTYDESGDYRVTLATEQDTVTRTISVNSANIEIANLDRDIGGTLLPKLGIDEGVEATINTADGQDIDRVEFYFAGQKAISKSPPYDASLTIDDIEPPATPLTVRAVTTDGMQQDFQQDIPIQRLPDWLEFLLKSTDTLGVALTDEEIEITYTPLSNLAPGIDIPNDLLGGDESPRENGDGDYDFGVAMGGIYDPRTNEAELTAAGNITAEVMALAFEIKVALIGEIEATTLELQSAQADIDSLLSFDVAPPTIPVPVSIPIPGTDSAIGIVPTILISADGTFDFNADLSFDTGTVEPGVELQVSIGIALELPALPDGELKGVPSGGIDGQFDVGTDDWNIQATFFLAGKVVLDPPFLPGITLEQDPIWDQPLTGSTTEQVTATTVSRPRVCHKSAGGPQPLPEIDSVDTVSVDTDTISPRESFRLTDRPYEDIEPVLASPAENTQVVIWGQQAENKPADAGHDLVGRWYENGSWSKTFAITDDTYANASPVCAAMSTGEILLAWKRLPEDLTASGEQLDTLAAVNNTRDKAEIAYSIYDGNSWSDPTLLTSTSVTQRRPTVAKADGEWHLAWESFDRETGSTTVRSTVVSPDGTTAPISEWSGAASPDLGRRNDGTVDLAYLVWDGAQVTGVTHTIRDGTATMSDQTYSATAADTVVVSNGRVLWATNTNRDPTLVEGTDGTTTELSLREDVAEVRELSFSSRSDEAILSYISTLEGKDTRDQVYRLDRGNGWIFDRRITENIKDGLRVRYSDLVFAGSASFLSAYAVRDTGTDAVSDVFATLQEFGPAYAIDGSIDSGTAGGETTLSYTLENRGDVDGAEQVTVRILRDGTEIKAITHKPLESGGTLARNWTVTVGDGGEFELQLDVPEPSLETEPHSVELIAATVQLRVDTVAATRIGPSEATIAVTVTNHGGAVAENVPVELSDAAGPVGTPMLDRIEPETTTTVETVIDPVSLDNSDTHTVRLDPNERLPPQAETTSLRRTYLVRPDLRVEDIRYREDNDRFVRVLVSNHGPGEGTASLTIRDGTDTELATTDISLPPAKTENGSTVAVHRAIDLQVPTLEPAQTVAIEAEPDVSNLHQETLSRVETAEPILPGEYRGDVGDLTVNASNETIPVGGEASIDVSADNVGQLIIENIWTDWTVSVDVPSDIVEKSVEANGRVTLTWPSTKSAVSPTLAISVPDRYIGGTYEVNLTATNASDVAETTSMLVIK